MNSSFTHSLDAFFSGPDRVLVIRGNWGVGKTYSWDAYISARISKKNLGQIAYSYVSLFGKSSLTDVRSSVFQCAKPVSSDQVIDAANDKLLSEATQLRDRLPWVRSVASLANEKAPFLGWLTKTAKAAPFTDKFSPLLATLEYSLVGNYVICIDDLERKGSTLSVREVMGLIDELAQRKKCKVILIFNDKSLSNDLDRSEFDSYREKVVDSELEFSPSHEENLNKVYSPEHKLYPYFSGPIEALNLKNIRVLKKLRRMTDQIEATINGCQPEILQEYATHASLLLWSYYMRSEALPHSFVVEQSSSSSWATFFRKEGSAPTEDEKRYKTIISAIRVEPSIFSRHILEYLRRGYFDLAAVQSEVDDLIQKAEMRRASERLRDVWKLYSDSFIPSQEEVVQNLRRVLTEEAKLLSVSDYSGALSMLASLSDDPTELMHEYVQLHKEDLATMDKRDHLYARLVSYEPMRTEIDQLNVDCRRLNIDDVSYRIAKNQGWNPGDIEFLVTLTADDFYQWIKSSPSDLTLKLRSGLLLFRNLSGSRPEENDSYSRIHDAVETALRRLATESAIGKMRVKHIYDIDTET